jgi:excisionase family DNA binding protein
MNQARASRVLEDRTLLKMLSYTIDEAALATGRSKTRLKKAIRDKELTALKDGRATLITQDELKRWLGAMRTIGRDPEEAIEPIKTMEDFGEGRVP